MRNLKCFTTFFVFLFIAGYEICQAQINKTMQEILVPNKYGIMKIISRDVTLYELPKVESRKLSTIPLNTIVQRTRECDEWCRIKMYNDGPEGWIASKFLEDCPAAELDGAIIPPSISIINPVDDSVELKFLQNPPADWRYFKYQAKYFKVDRDSMTAVDKTNGLDFFVNREYAVLIPHLNKIYFNIGEITSVSASDFKVLNVVDLKKGFIDIAGSSSTKIPNPDYMALSSNDLVFITSRHYNESYLYVVDPKMDKLISVISDLPGMWSIAASSNGKVYITCPWSGEVIVIDASKQEVLNRISIPEGPVKIIFYKNKLYVTTYREGVIILDAVTDKVIKRVNVGPAPGNIWVGENGKIYVWNTASYYWD